METTQDKLAYWLLRQRDAERALSVARRQIMNYTTELLDELEAIIADLKDAEVSGTYDENFITRGELAEILQAFRKAFGGK